MRLIYRVVVRGLGGMRSYIIKCPYVIGSVKLPQTNLVTEVCVQGRRLTLVPVGLICAWVDMKDVEGLSRLCGIRGVHESVALPAVAPISALLHT